MTAPFLMIRLQPDLARVAGWGHDTRLVARGGDLSYALHALLAAAFGDHAPKPFRLHEAHRRTGARGGTILYGYTNADETTLQEFASIAPPEVKKALALDGLEATSMPATWNLGRRFGFEARVRPVIRQHRPGAREKTRERDAFLVACDEAGDEQGVERTTVYGAWLRQRVERAGGARLVERDDGPAVVLAAFRRTRVARRDRDRGLRAVEGPDAVLAGILEVTDGTAFGRLVRRGIGRHRAFGYGMLLLRPPPASTP